MGSASSDRAGRTGQARLMPRVLAAVRSLLPPGRRGLARVAPPGLTVAAGAAGHSVGDLAMRPPIGRWLFQLLLSRHRRLAARPTELQRRTAPSTLQPPNEAGSRPAEALIQPRHRIGRPAALGRAPGLRSPRPLGRAPLPVPRGIVQRAGEPLISPRAQLVSPPVDGPQVSGPVSVGDLLVAGAGATPAGVAPEAGPGTVRIGPPAQSPITSWQPSTGLAWPAVTRRSAAGSVPVVAGTGGVAAPGGTVPGIARARWHRLLGYGSRPSVPRPGGSAAPGAPAAGAGARRGFDLPAPAPAPAPAPGPAGAASFSQPDPVDELPTAPAARWQAVVRARPLETPQLFPTALRPWASAVSGRSAPRFTSGPSTRAALRSVGARGASSGDVVHLASAPASSHDPVVAHELAHLRQPLGRPRFKLVTTSGSQSEDERRAVSAELVATLPVAGPSGFAGPGGSSGTAGGSPPGSGEQGRAEAAVSLVTSPFGSARPETTSTSGTANAFEASPAGGASGGGQVPVAASPGAGSPAAAAPSVVSTPVTLADQIRELCERRGLRYS